QRKVNFRCFDNYGRPSHEKSTITASFIFEAVQSAIEYVQDERNRTVLDNSKLDTSGTIRQAIERVREQIKKCDEAIHRADDAYVLGSMDIDRYQRQVNRLQNQRANLHAEIARYEQELEAELFNAHRSDRLREIAAV